MCFIWNFCCFRSPEARYNEVAARGAGAGEQERQRCKHPFIHLSFSGLKFIYISQELDLVEDGAVVYKLIGPVLVKQDLSEAKQTVDKRLEYIRKEM